MVQKNPQVSAILHAPAALNWLNEIMESSAILSAIIAVIHPELYNTGRGTLNRLRQVPKIQPQDVLNKWTSIFNGVSVISNRTTPLHRDGNSRFHWYDLLATFGRYQNCKLELPGLGVALEYGPGTVVGLSGSMLEHAVTSFEGERVCYAYFMRDNVCEWARVPGGTYMNVKYYE
jgi:Oxygenase domain of the 2OGFeDO superfamily